MLTELNRPVAIPAFSPNEWEDWRRTNIDGHDYFGVPHECWRITTDYSTALIEAKGGVAIVTRVAIRDFLLWCKRSGFPYDTNSRARYAAFLSLDQ